ncbi:MAG: inositol monophosphatase family protein [Acidimicrobiales bacterium]
MPRRAAADSSIGSCPDCAVDHHGLRVDTKTTLTDLVTEYDRLGGDHDRRGDHGRSSRRRPRGARRGASRSGTTGVEWVIDPIDGTTNFVYDLPGSSVSIARVDGDTVVGAVHDLVRDERFLGHRGGGATLDGVAGYTGITDLSTALVATGFSYGPDRRRLRRGCS